MKKIGKEVLFLPTKEGNPRNGEGTFARLRDGRILYLYTEYYGEKWADDAIAHLCACYSSDEGETWSTPTVFLEKEPFQKNIMSPSLFRLPNGDLGLVYLAKELLAGTEACVVCLPLFRRSSDEGKTWCTPTYCAADPGYYCAINDGVCVTRDGRILVPMSYHGPYVDLIQTGELNQPVYSGTVLIACSEDGGNTWNFMHRFVSPFTEDTSGLAEPGVYEHENGDLWMYCRTTYGHQYQSHSVDGGQTWSPVIPNLCFTSPDSPMRVKRVGNYTVAVFNPLPYHCLRTDFSRRGNTKRTPLACAVSTDDARSFDSTGKDPHGGQFLPFQQSVSLIEDDMRDSYCYPAILATQDGFLVAYYHSNGGTYTLASTKMSKIFFDELT